MKRFLICLVAAAGLVLSAAAIAGAESSVWVVRGPKTTLYLAGSCHVLRASDHPLPREFDAAYADSQRLIFEAPPAELETPDYIQKLMRVAALTDGTTLRDHLSPSVYARAEKFCRERGYPFEQYQLFRPWMLAMFLTMQELTRIGVAPEFGVDKIYYEKAKKDGKPAGGLETADDQIRFLAAMDADLGNDQVIETLDDLAALNDKLPQILNAWRTGNEAGIEAFSLRELKNHPNLYKTLIVERNRKWADKIEPLIRKGQNVMIIVGVAHLAGSDSVIALLKKRGHSVSKLTLRP
ncbi:MAG TPA: TraB/GumN family protein [Smithellaceae bacterium]|nr:TraB/GumN family protein [Smithellaceae bacterium]